MNQAGIGPLITGYVNDVQSYPSSDGSLNPDWDKFLHRQLMGSSVGSEDGTQDLEGTSTKPMQLEGKDRDDLDAFMKQLISRMDKHHEELIHQSKIQSDSILTAIKQERGKQDALESAVTTSLSNLGVKIQELREDLNLKSKMLADFLSKTSEATSTCVANSEVDELREPLAAIRADIKNSSKVLSELMVMTSRKCEHEREGLVQAKVQPSQNPREAVEIESSIQADTSLAPPVSKKDSTLSSPSDNFETKAPPKQGLSLAVLASSSRIPTRDVEFPRHQFLPFVGRERDLERRQASLVTEKDVRAQTKDLSSINTPRMRNLSILGRRTQKESDQDEYRQEIETPSGNREPDLAENRSLASEALSSPSFSWEKQKDPIEPNAAIGISRPQPYSSRNSLFDFFEQNSNAASSISSQSFETSSIDGTVEKSKEAEPIQALLAASISEDSEATEVDLPDDEKAAVQSKGLNASHEGVKITFGNIRPRKEVESESRDRSMSLVAQRIKSFDLQTLGR